MVWNKISFEQYTPVHKEMFLSPYFSDLAVQIGRLVDSGSGFEREDCVMKVFWRPGWHDAECDLDHLKAPKHAEMHALCEQ